MERMARQSYGLKTVISKISTIRSKKMAAKEQFKPAILWCDTSPLSRSKKLTIFPYQVLFIRYFQYNFDSHSIPNLGNSLSLYFLKHHFN